MDSPTLFSSPKTGHQILPLDESHNIEAHFQVPAFTLTQAEFEALWNEHPADYHELVMHGKKVKTPRWQQAYGCNYEYTGSRNNALPIGPILEKYVNWCQQKVDSRLNGLLLNWYDGSSKHYIGKHRDSIKGLIEGSPIVTISLGEERVFRMRPWRGDGFQDITVRHGDVLVIPWDTNMAYTHEVPHFVKYTGKRISVTLRAYG